MAAQPAGRRVAAGLYHDRRLDRTGLPPFFPNTYGGQSCTAACIVFEQKCYQYWDVTLRACNRREGSACKSCGSAFRKETWVPPSPSWPPPTRAARCPPTR